MMALLIITKNKSHDNSYITKHRLEQTGDYYFDRHDEHAALQNMRTAVEVQSNDVSPYGEDHR
jgi:hypothetical protein